MVPYRVSAWVPSTASASGREFKLYGTFAESDDAALSTVSRVVTDGWQICGVDGVLSRAEVEALRLTHGEVRELQGAGRS
jgi:hypothetical protein